ncbi:MULTISPECIES: NADH-quinone oxidoreductase subunit NuoE [unclassified Sulfurospirillum]|uniref:NADH-quinone oxidoreductase subunit NuoE n=1 Tax=unclassified Sulfurospirillum TaxID=2618290 RepID=UPI000504D638|nr:MULTISPECIES: NADH-quinone oxidoreductase subunit NuoE [unclassified Sulfurospirillum]KFL34756.1 NADH-quinone oxidoreductase subunit E [Sulfurospirillum sp. SCADC]
MSTFLFNQDNEEKFSALLERYPDKSSLMLPSLWMVQYQEGWISLDAMQFVAKKLGCSAMDVYSVASFYSMFLLQPIGTHHIQLCKTLSCMLAGAKTLQEHLQNRLGIKAGETTKNGKFTLSLVECLGSCGTSPCMRLNDDYIENLTLEKLDALLEELSK